MTFDVFSGQMTDSVMQKLKENFIKVVKVPENISNLFQPLDLTVNGSAKVFMKRKLTEWYSSSISKQLDKGKSTDDIDVDLKLSIPKPLHAHWIKELYDYMTSQNGSKIMSNGRKAAFITETSKKAQKASNLLTRLLPLIC